MQHGTGGGDKKRQINKRDKHDKKREKKSPAESE